MDQVGAMYKISEILSKAFKEVNDVCAHYLADQTVSNSKVPKSVEKKAVPEKSHVNLASKIESIVKKDHKAEGTPLQKPKSQPVPESAPSPKPTQQTKPKQVQKQQIQSKSDKKAAPHPDKPKQPLTAFFLFQQDQKENVLKMHPGASITDLTKMMGEIWRGLDEDEKSPYLQKSEELKVQYNKKLQKFYDKHPEEKTKKQLKKEKQEAKQEAKQEPSPVIVSGQKSSSGVKLPVKKSVVVVEEENSESD